MKKRSTTVLIILLLALIAAGVAVKKIYLGTQFLYSGTLEATKVDLSSQLSSTIAEVKKQEGDRVSANEAIITLTCDDTKVDAKLAASNYDRGMRLLKAGSMSQEAWDLVRNRKEESDVRLSWCSITSPISGTVLSRYHEPGEWVTPGTKILTLANIRDIWAYIYVPQPQVANLKAGMKLKGYLPELHNREFEGTILKINDEAEFTPKNVQTREERTRLVYGVKVSFLNSNAEETLKPGMTIEVALPKG